MVADGLYSSGRCRLEELRKGDGVWGAGTVSKCTAMVPTMDDG